MTSTEENKEKTGSQEKSEKPAESALTDPRLKEMIKKSQEVPIPSKDDFWKIEIEPATQKQNRVLGIFKKKDINAQEINQLRKSALQSPGNTRVAVNKLIKKYPQNPTLLMISAICTHGMLMNSSNQNEIVQGLKGAVKDCANALMSDGISVYNCENFLRIYYTLIDRFKRFQIRTYDMVLHDPRLEKSKNSLTYAMRITDLLGADKNKSMNVIAHLKKKLKTTAHYTANLSFLDINNAARLVEQGKTKEQCGITTAGELIAYVYALLIAFARIPILSPLVTRILELLPSASKALFLRKVSVRSVENFMRFKIAAIESRPEQMQKLGRIILKENMVAVQKLEGHALYQIYETDPFFNIAIAAELTYGLFKSDDQLKILTTAIQAVENVIKRDMTKNHIFTESARTHTHRLTALKEGASVEGGGEAAGKSADPAEAVPK